MADTTPGVPSAAEIAAAATSEAQIAVHWREEEYYQPPAAFVGQANASDPAIFDRFGEERFPDCFKEYADLLTWDAVLAHDARHQQGAVLEVVRRRAAERVAQLRRPPSRVAPQQGGSIWVPEPEDEETQAITYQELYRRVNEFAALLRGFCGVQTGDRVTFHLPMVPELPVSMLACARLGVDPLGGVRRVQRRSLRRAHRRLGEPDPRDDGLLLPQRRADRPQGEGRRGDRGRARGGAEVEKVLVWRRTRASTHRRARWSRGATSSSTS